MTYFSFIYFYLQFKTRYSCGCIKCLTMPEYNFASKRISWDLFWNESERELSQGKHLERKGRSKREDTVALAAPSIRLEKSYELGAEMYVPSFWDLVTRSTSASGSLAALPRVTAILRRSYARKNSMREQGSLCAQKLNAKA